MQYRRATIAFDRSRNGRGNQLVAHFSPSPRSSPTATLPNQLFLSTNILDYKIMYTERINWKNIELIDYWWNNAKYMHRADLHRINMSASGRLWLTSALLSYRIFYFRFKMNLSCIALSRKIVSTKVELVWLYSPVSTGWRGWKIRVVSHVFPWSLLATRTGHGDRESCRRREEERARGEREEEAGVKS